MATNDKVNILFDLGEASQNGSWPDYLQYGFGERDVPALLALVADDSLNNADQDSNEIWVPLHAWRALGQIGSKKAIVPLITQFESFLNDDWALSELSKVMGMIGEAAIEPLAAYINERQNQELARSMAMEGLAEIAKRHPDVRGRVIQCYQDYMQSADESARLLNGLLVGQLLDLRATEVIDDIRRLFNKGCVDIRCAGDLDDVEIELGFRTKRAFPIPDINALYGLNTTKMPKKKTNRNEIFEIINNALERYGHDNSLIDVSELDGFFAALACSPDTILPSQWMPAIWYGEEYMPKWETEKELVQFNESVMKLYNEVIQCLYEDHFQALFNQYEEDGKVHFIVDDWCNGFMHGMDLWGALSSEDAALTESLTKPLKLFMTEAGFNKRRTMSEDEIVAQQQLIEPNVIKLYKHFLKKRGQVKAPIVRDKEKIGRNDPCFCGSGKKFKNCCLH